MSIDSSPPETAQPKRRMTRILGFAAIVLLLLILGIVPRLGRRDAAMAQARSVEDDVPIVSTSQVKAAPPSSELLLPGNTQAVTVAAIYARASGYVSKRLVDIGSKVKAGQLLAVIESPEVDQELAQAKANAQQARAAVEQGLRERGTKRPEAAWPIEPLRELGSLESSRRGEREIRIKGGACDSDLCVGRGHLALEGRNIRTPFE